MVNWFHSLWQSRQATTSATGTVTKSTEQQTAEEMRILNLENRANMYAALYWQQVSETAKLTKAVERIQRKLHAHKNRVTQLHELLDVYGIERVIDNKTLRIDDRIVRLFLHMQSRISACNTDNAHLLDTLGRMLSHTSYKEPNGG